ncbi:hypothetical protein HZ326_0993 [Fusarium oxysporum f. sp. albedinis]|nr:hypothetical protein HZ326_0993 [Fusarium oxysporum f. sp. albedinis]
MGDYVCAVRFRCELKLGVESSRHGTWMILQDLANGMHENRESLGELRPAEITITGAAIAGKYSTCSLLSFLDLETDQSTRAQSRRNYPNIAVW